MKKHTIFWADDDADDLELFHLVLSEQTSEFDVVEFANGSELLHRLTVSEDTSNPCLIILDMNMPVMDGRETLRKLKENPRLQAIPTVVFTTSSSEMDKTFCNRYHTEMVTKPPTYTQLKPLVSHLLAHCKH